MTLVLIHHLVELKMNQLAVFVRVSIALDLFIDIGGLVSGS